MQAILVGQSASQVVVDIHVIDNGIGMDQDTQQRLFTPFTQAEVSTTRRFGGTGLGLTIARNLTHLMGGDITVQSSLGHGSVFTVRVPFLRATDIAEEATADSLVAGVTCLVVGDADGVAPYVSAYLMAAGAEVEQFPDLLATRLRMDQPFNQPWVCLIDAGAKQLLWADMMALLGTQQVEHAHFVVVGRGRRRRPPRQDTDQVVRIDANVLTRQTVIEAVAIAAGRLKAEIATLLTGKDERAFVAPLRDQARQQGKLLLVAEDNETNQKVIRQQLALLGFAADVVDNGQQALERWRQGDYPLLLTDLHMPEMDGYELARAIRAEENGSHQIVIIALTANAITGEELRCLGAGMDGYLSKPAPLADLEAMLYKWLPQVAFCSVDNNTFGKTLIKTTTPINLTILEGLVGDFPDVINDFLHSFYDSARPLVSGITAALAAGQVEQARVLAHKLKSPARSVGAMALGDLCADIEQACKTEAISAFTDLLGRFEDETTAVFSYLETLKLKDAIVNGTTREKP